MAFHKVGLRYTGAEMEDAPVGTVAHNEDSLRVVTRISDAKNGWDQKHPDHDYVAKGGLAWDYWYVVDSIPGELKPPTNEDVERVALDLYVTFNPTMPDPFMGPEFETKTPTHIDDVFDGGRWRKMAKHVIANYGKGE